MANPFYIGAIDIGTNSTHLLIALIKPSLNTFSIEIAEKCTTRLGERDPASGDLTDIAMNNVVEALRHFEEITRSYNVCELLTAATSAVREAPNGAEFISRLKEELDIEVNMISGSEEARLIYLGVLSGMPFEDRPYIIIDIGGGSTELILADANDARALTSTKLGAVRLQRQFIRNDSIFDYKKEFLKAYIQGSLEPAIDKIKKRILENESPLLVATSGTAMALGSLIANEDYEKNIKLHGYTFSRNNLEKMVNKLIDMNIDQRKKLSSINERRAEIIVPGALILETSMQLLGFEKVILSERALREGLIVDWMIKKGLLQDRFTYQKNIRKRTVRHQVERFSVNAKRADFVASNAMIFYDSTKGVLHNDHGKGRELLWAASMLHACGKHINRAAYHKHSWYLIRNGELLGYSQFEHLMVAAIARYHRKSLPKKRHESWQILSNKEQRDIVYEMALILRLSASIDKRPEPILSSIKIKSDKNKIVCDLIPKDSSSNLSLEKWSLKSCSSIIKEVKGVDLIVIDS